MVHTVAKHDVIQNRILRGRISNILTNFNISNTITVDCEFDSVVRKFVEGKWLPVDINIHVVFTWLHIWNLDIGIPVLSGVLVSDESAVFGAITIALDNECNNISVFIRRVSIKESLTEL